MKTLALGFALVGALMFAPVAVAANSGAGHASSPDKKGANSTWKKGSAHEKFHHRQVAKGTKGKTLGKPGKKIAKPPRHPSTTGSSKTGKHV